MFLCGCSLWRGVVLIMVFHLLANILYIGMTFNHIVLFHGPGLINDWSAAWQFSMIGFELCGIPIIVAAIIGIFKRIEVAMRSYLLYLFCSFFLDTSCLYYMLIWSDRCDKVNGLKVAQFMGGAFMCGLEHILAYFFVAAAISIQVYCLYTVWSYCEDIHEGQSGPGLWELLPGKEDAFQTSSKHLHGDGHNRQGPYDHIVGITYWGDNGGAYPSPYGAFDTSPMAMFGGAHAEHGEH